jgi:hypothetical protein
MNITEGLESAAAKGLSYLHACFDKGGGSAAELRLAKLCLDTSKEANNRKRVEGKGTKKLRGGTIGRELSMFMRFPLRSCRSLMRLSSATPDDMGELTPLERSV